jgi:hypothetical protein
VLGFFSGMDGPRRRWGDGIWGAVGQAEAAAAENCGGGWPAGPAHSAAAYGEANRPQVCFSESSPGPFNFPD